MGGRIICQYRADIVCVSFDSPCCSVAGRRRRLIGQAARRIIRQYSFTRILNLAARLLYVHRQNIRLLHRSWIYVEVKIVHLHIYSSIIPTLRQ